MQKPLEIQGFLWSWCYEAALALDRAEEVVQEVLLAGPHVTRRRVLRQLVIQDEVPLPGGPHVLEEINLAVVPGEHGGLEVVPLAVGRFDVARAGVAGRRGP